MILKVKVTDRFIIVKNVENSKKLAIYTIDEVKIYCYNKYNYNNICYLLYRSIKTDFLKSAAKISEKLRQDVS